MFTNRQSKESESSSSEMETESNCSGVLGLLFYQTDRYWNLNGYDYKTKTKQIKNTTWGMRGEQAK